MLYIYINNQNPLLILYYSISRNLYNYHCPDTNPFGRQQQAYFKQLVELKKSLVSPTPVNVKDNSFEK